MYYYYYYTCAYIVREIISNSSLLTPIADPLLIIMRSTNEILCFYKLFRKCKTIYINVLISSLHLLIIFIHKSNVRLELYIF